MTFIHRELTGVKLSVIGCTSALSSICEATQQHRAIIVRTDLLVHGTTSNLAERDACIVCVRRFQLAVKEA